MMSSFPWKRLHDDAVGTIEGLRAPRGADSYVGEQGAPPQQTVSDVAPVGDTALLHDTADDATHGEQRHTADTPGIPGQASSYGPGGPSASSATLIGQDVPATTSVDADVSLDPVVRPLSTGGAASSADGVLSPGGCSKCGK